MPVLRKGSRDYHGIIVLHPHLVLELDREEDIILPGDDDSAFVDWGADFEIDAIVREEDELGGAPTYTSRKKSLKPRRGRPAKPKVEYQEL